MKVYVLSQATEDGDFEVLSVHGTEKHAEDRLDQVANEEDYDEKEKEDNLVIEDFKVQGPIET